MLWWNLFGVREPPQKHEVMADQGDLAERTQKVAILTAMVGHLGSQSSRSHVSGSQSLWQFVVSLVKLLYLLTDFIGKQWIKLQNSEFVGNLWKRPQTFGKMIFFQEQWMPCWSLNIHLSSQHCRGLSCCEVWSWPSWVSCNCLSWFDFCHAPHWVVSQRYRKGLSPVEEWFGGFVWSFYKHDVMVISPLLLYLVRWMNIDKPCILDICSRSAEKSGFAWGVPERMAMNTVMNVCACNYIW